MIRRLLHPWLTVRAQIALGAVFVAAALPKLADPPGFAEALWNHQLAPAWLVHPAALTLPWLELLCGLALCLGVWTRAAAGWLTALLLVFVTALSINLARHHPVDCGCFQTQTSARSADQRVGDMRWAILRDLGLLALAAQILAAGAVRRP
ncbi:MAG: MauE/DoxX family redox-associated membrane protein [Holophaga sp.]|nr:MauE/DoxX family redox-associated membrane protein [Holophaga sp.]